MSFFGAHVQSLTSKVISTRTKKRSIASTSAGHILASHLGSCAEQFSKASPISLPQAKSPPASRILRNIPRTLVPTPGRSSSAAPRQAGMALFGHRYRPAGHLPGRHARHVRGDAGLLRSRAVITALALLSAGGLTAWFVPGMSREQCDDRRLRTLSFAASATIKLRAAPTYPLPITPTRDGTAQHASAARSRPQGRTATPAVRLAPADSISDGRRTTARLSTGDHDGQLDIPRGGNLHDTHLLRLPPAQGLARPEEGFTDFELKVRRGV